LERGERKRIGEKTGSGGGGEGWPSSVGVVTAVESLTKKGKKCTSGEDKKGGENITNMGGGGPTSPIPVVLL